MALAAGAALLAQAAASRTVTLALAVAPTKPAVLAQAVESTAQAAAMAAPSPTRMAKMRVRETIPRLSAQAAAPNPRHPAVAAWTGPADLALAVAGFGPIRSPTKVVVAWSDPYQPFN